eukprot:3555387-Rhodomonas_salina.1
MSASSSSHTVSASMSTAVPPDMWLVPDSASQNPGQMHTATRVFFFFFLQSFCRLSCATPVPESAALSANILTVPWRQTVGILRDTLSASHSA